MPEWKIGDRIENRYEIHQILGGGMGVVYICYDHESKLPLALKTFQDRYLQNQQMRERFIREAETWIALEKHQNIVRAVWVENIQGKPYIILEYIANPEMGGADLGRWIRRGMEIPQVLNFAVQFCDGMDYAYKKVGMVHRDIKPGNILVTQDRVVKITDFGLVKTVLAETAGEDFPETTGQEVVSGRVAFTHSRALGTPPYMSPEQWLHPQQADMRSDIYSFGVVLYEMLTGQWVFKATTLKAFKDCHLDEPPPAPTSVVPGLPCDLEAVVLRCLAKDPEQRYPDFALLREELAEVYHPLTGEEIAPAVEGEALEAWEWSNKGISLAALGHPEEALICYDHALDIDPRLAQALANKGSSLEALGRYEEAITCCDRALDLNPSLAQAWINKGASLEASGRHEEAITYFNRALDIDIRDANAWYNKGNSLAALGRHEEALACHDHALALNPRDAQTWVNKGVSLAALGRYEEAITCCDRALDLNPRFATAWYNKGSSLADLRRYEEAITCFDCALDINLRYAQVWLNKGGSLAALGRYEEALQCYDSALEIDPRLAQAWFNKGAIFANSGRFQEALGYFTKVLEIDPYYENAKQAIALCQQDLKQG